MYPWKNQELKTKFEVAQAIYKSLIVAAPDEELKSTPEWVAMYHVGRDAMANVDLAVALTSPGVVRSFFMFYLASLVYADDSSGAWSLDASTGNLQPSADQPSAN